MIREKELRLALICYGGVSLAVYMHGITKELWKLLRASEAAKSRGAASGDTEPVWQALLAEIGRTTELAVICDILAGASAGGLNAVLLSNALTLGQSLEPLTDMWLERADVETLMDPAARPESGVPARLAQFYKEPVAWFAARQSASLASVDVPEVRAEVALKLARFVRSRWFKPPFSGAGLTAMLDEAMDAMEVGPAGAPLLPPTLPLSLFVTATDYWGVNAELHINSPPVVVEREHRRLFAFESHALTLIHSPVRRQEAGEAPTLPKRRAVAERPALLLAARATASFPGAFPPASIVEVDERLAETGRDWPGRAAFVASQLASDRPPEEVALIDGSVLHNAPFGPAIAAVRLRPSHREVDRRFVYIDPTPGTDGPMAAFDKREPGFFTAMLRAMADIPRAQPIRDSLESIARLSERSRRMRAVTDAMTTAVDEAILRAVGARFFLLPVSPERLAKARSRIHSQAAREAGFAFGAYAQLKLQAVLDEAADIVARSGDFSRAEADSLRRGLEQAAIARGAFAHDAAIGGEAEGSGYVRLLKQLDIHFRVRRLRFFIRRLSAAIAASTDLKERESGEALKAALHAAVAPFEARRGGIDEEDRKALADTARALLHAPAAEARAEAGGALIDRLALTLRLSALDAEADRVLVAAALDPGFGRPMRRALIRAWLGFPFYDIAILPLIRDEGFDGFEELKVDRISPDDASALMEGGTRACLKGWQLNAFAGFFSRAYRENDYLWGRLHAAERLVDIVASAVPEVSLDVRYWKTQLFEAIVEAERPRLQRVEPLFDDLEERVAKWGQGERNPPKPG
ncbi:patatin-like protein [Sandaracinobacter sp. RS1-74]|uniref:patatin-like protein n=1 Tax=Sandaracinobacteroides sayramensis TaxID=2913411 RepID=UPI001EDB218F|nr:patatin-like protein [Sandaracinobacteroides sayramensis]MCG2841635.1 patatin-like protein [Sandaracinobacteroides sayramensis]